MYINFIYNSMFITTPRFSEFYIRPTFSDSFASTFCLTPFHVDSFPCTGLSFKYQVTAFVLCSSLCEIVTVCKQIKLLLLYFEMHEFIFIQPTILWSTHLRVFIIAIFKGIGSEKRILTVTRPFIWKTFFLDLSKS